jgi:hypothetical protein
MKYWLEKGIEELYFFMHMHDEATSPELTVYLVDKMNKEMGLNLIKPKFIDSNSLPAANRNLNKKDCLTNESHITLPILWYNGGFLAPAAFSNLS